MSTIIRIQTLISFQHLRKNADVVLTCLRRSIIGSGGLARACTGLARGLHIDLWGACTAHMHMLGVSGVPAKACAASRRGLGGTGWVSVPSFQRTPSSAPIVADKAATLSAPHGFNIVSVALEVA